ncbi:hypothetical protein H8K32_11505 [Undibacterium jejuense]|uniref:Uncharacterized protein n=1 Tax=Undibacterium jejuense TaxID=1344949 RepID=A0A923HKU9_9BURK|nr:hypothetical protein [Undibacterium jejuense]MBC3862729.1 hypothetical protein [Undibacterium jejuense]
MKTRHFKLSLVTALLFSTASITTLAQEPALDLHVQCTQTKLEDGNGERLIFADQAHIKLHGNTIDDFQWESSLFRTDHGHECSIDKDDQLLAEVTEKGWRISLKDAIATRTQRGYDFDRGYQCSIRVEREGEMVHIRPTCPALCGSRMNFTELKINTSNGQCEYQD